MDFFKKMINICKQMNYAQFRSPQYVEFQKQLQEAGCRKKSKISEINKWVENGDKSFSKNIYKD